MNKMRIVLLLLTAMAILTLNVNAVVPVEITYVVPAEANSAYSGFTPNIGAAIVINTDAYIGRMSNNTQEVGFPTQWSVVITGPTSLSPDMVDMDEVGWNTTFSVNLSERHYEFVEDAGVLRALGPCAGSEHDGCDKLIWTILLNEVAMHVDRIKFNTTAPVGGYNITYVLMDVTNFTPVPISNEHNVSVYLTETNPPLLSDSRIISLITESEEDLFVRLVANGNITDGTGQPLNATEPMLIKTNATDNESGIRNVSVIISGIDVPASIDPATGEYQAIVPSEHAIGAHSIVIKATDNEGNTATKELSYRTLQSILLCEKTDNHPPGVPWGCNDPSFMSFRGVFGYIPEGYNLVYKLIVGGLTVGQEYTLIYYPDHSPQDYFNDTRVFLGNATAVDIDRPAGVGTLFLKNTIYLGHNIPLPTDVNAKWGRGKVWLIPSEDYDRANNTMKSWNPETYLFEEDFNMSLTIENGSVGGISYRYVPPPTPTPTPRISTGSGGSTGGGGIITDEPPANVASSERYEKNWVNNVPVSYGFKGDVYEVSILPAASEDSIMVKVETLKDKSAKTSPATGVYKYINLYSGSKRFGSGTIKFKVDSNWAQGKTLSLMRWDGKAWVQLETNVLSKDGKFVYLEAKTGAFSNFAIVGSAAVASTPTAIATTIQPAPEVTTIPKVQETPKETPGFEATFAIAGLVAIIYTMRKVRK